MLRWCSCSKDAGHWPNGGRCEGRPPLGFEWPSMGSGINDCIASYAAGGSATVPLCPSLFALATTVTLLSHPRVGGPETTGSWSVPASNHPPNQDHFFHETSSSGPRCPSTSLPFNAAGPSTGS